MTKNQGGGGRRASDGADASTTLRGTTLMGERTEARALAKPYYRGADRRSAIGTGQGGLKRLSGVIRGGKFNIAIGSEGGLQALSRSEADNRE